MQGRHAYGLCNLKNLTDATISVFGWELDACSLFGDDIPCSVILCEGPQVLPLR